MLIYKCSNKECRFAPCFCRCDAASNMDDFAELAYNKPQACPYAMEADEDLEPKWRLASETAVASNAFDMLDDWFSSHYDEIPESIREVVEDLTPFHHGCGCNPTQLMAIMGLIREAELDRCACGDMWQELEKKKYSKKDIAVATMQAGFRAGMIYALMLAARPENDVLTRRNEE